MIAYAYPESEDPVGAYEWWLSPCGGSDLVPEDIKRVFEILSTVAEGASSFTTPKNIPRGSGRKGDAANPTDRSKPKAGTGSGPNGTGNTGVKKKRKCNVPPAKSSTIMGPAKNTLRLQSCVAAAGGASTTTKKDLVITSLAFGAKPTTVSKVCSQQWSQACYHYSSAVANNPQWEVLQCVHGNVKNPATNRPGPYEWYKAHDDSWLSPADRTTPSCDADEYPPRYLLSDSSPEVVNAGRPGGQLIRYVHNEQNQRAGSMWKGVCFTPHIAGLTPSEFKKKWDDGPAAKKVSRVSNGITQQFAEVSIDVLPSFKISKYEHDANPPRDAGMWENECWPSLKAANDPGFTLWSWDPWYNTHPHLYDFSQKYEKGVNGV